MLALWGANAVMERRYNVLDVWRESALDVRGKAMPCGHFIPEEAPEQTIAELTEFFGT